MPKIREWFETQWNEDTTICAICGSVIVSYEDAGLDHVIPISRNGKSGLENCVIVHQECNRIKGDFTLQEIHYLINCVNPEALEILKNRLKRSTLIFQRKY